MFYRMTCGDNEQWSKSKFQRKHTKQDQSKHGPLKQLGVGSVAMEELESSVDQSHPQCAFVVVG